MPKLENQTILDMKFGNVISKNRKDKVVLMGSSLDKYKAFMEDINVKIYTDDEKEAIVKKVPYSGYFFELFLGDFNGDNKDEIMVRGEFGGTGRFGIAAIYSYEDGKLIPIFTQDMFSEKYSFEAKYLEGYKVIVNSDDLSQNYIFDISKRPKTYLDIIYDEEGKIRKFEKPTVSNINDAFPIKFVFKENYYLFIRQRVIGVANADTIGYIESFVQLLGNEIKAVNTGSYQYGEREDAKEQKPLKKEERQSTNVVEDLDKEKEILNIIGDSNWGEEDFKRMENLKKEEKKSNKEGNKAVEKFKNALEKFPKGTIFISPQDLGFQKEGIAFDLDLDGQKEVLIPYTLDGTPYIGVLKLKDKEYMLTGSFKGEGYDIEDFVIKNFGNRYYIFVGFKLGANMNKLQILTYKKERLVKAFKGKSYIYSKMYIEDLKGDGNNQLILWIQDTGKAYKIEIYDIMKKELKRTDKYDEIFFQGIVEYYKKLLEENKDSSTYLYHLSLAQIKIGDFENAVLNIEKNLNAKNPYPSVKELKKLKKRISKHEK